MQETIQITVEVVVKATIKKVWEFWNEPKHIKEWTHASGDWYTPHAENNLVLGGRFLTRMSAKDGSTGFDFVGTYTKIVPLAEISYVMEDGRKVHITFKEVEGGVKVTETFDIENENPAEMQRAGWQAILNNFKKYVEGN